MSDLHRQVASAFPQVGYAYINTEVLFMCETVELARPTAIFDWGTYVGASARLFCECSRILGLGATVFTVELPDELKALDGAHPDDPGLYIKDLDLNVVQLRGDGVTEALIAWKRTQPARSLFFLDGDHGWQMVHRELCLIQRMVPDATMLLHDTNSGPGFAANEWVQEHHGAYLYDYVADGQGLGRITKA